MQLPFTTSDDAEQAILHLARTRRSFNRHELQTALDLAGVTTCYERALERCEQNRDIETEAPGLWRSLICGGEA